MLTKEIKENLYREIDIPYLWIGRLRIGTVTMSVLPRWVYRFNANPVKISVRFFLSMDKFILKVI